MGRPPSQNATPQPQVPFRGQLWPLDAEHLASTAFQSAVPAFRLSSEAVPNHAFHAGAPETSTPFYQRTGKNTYDDDPAGAPEDTQHEHDMMDSLDATTPGRSSARTDPLQFHGEGDAESGASSSYQEFSARLGLQFHGGNSNSYQAGPGQDVLGAGSSAVSFPSSCMSMLDSRASDETYEPMMSSIAGFATAVFQGQAEICGISGVLAEHVVWLRKSPPGVVSPSGTNSAVYANVLETIETRLREIAKIAETKHQRAFQEMAAAIRQLQPGGDGGAVRGGSSSSGSSSCNPAYDIGELESDLEKQSSELSQFFKQRYNACASFAEQIQSIPSEKNT